MRKGGIDQELGDVLEQQRNKGWGHHGEGETANMDGRRRRQQIGDRRSPQEILRKLQGNREVIAKFLEENL